MTSYTLALLPGDGIGRDVMIEAEKILALVEQLTPLSLTVNKISCGGQHYLETGEEWPEGSFDFCDSNYSSFGCPAFYENRHSS